MSEKHVFGFYVLGYLRDIDYLIEFFQKDNTPVHGKKNTRQRFNTYDIVPAGCSDQMPDLNPIECQWVTFGEAIRSARIKNKEHLY